MHKLKISEAPKMLTLSKKNFRILPKHSLHLVLRDYLLCLRLPFAQPPPSLSDVWHGRLDHCELLWTPLGRHALWEYLDLLGLQPGDEVLVAAYNYYVIVRILIQRGLHPVFVDVESQTLCMDADDLARKLSSQTRLVVVTHMFGHPADLERISFLCAQARVPLFEDCAHAVGTLHDGKQVGQAGDGSLFSFGIYKIISAFSGGMLVLPSERRGDWQPSVHHRSPVSSFIDLFFRSLVAYCMRPGIYGWTIRPGFRVAKWLSACGQTALLTLIMPQRDNPAWRFNPVSGVPIRPFMTELIKRQLDNLDTQIECRRSIIRILKSRLADVDGVELLDEDRYGYANGSYFGILVPDPHALAKVFESQGVDCSANEFFNCASLDQFSEFASSCQSAQEVSTHLLRLPSYPTLNQEDIERIVCTIREFFDD